METRGFMCIFQLLVASEHGHVEETLQETVTLGTHAHTLYTLLYYC